MYDAYPAITALPLPLLLPWISSDKAKPSKGKGLSLQRIRMDGKLLLISTSKGRPKFDNSGEYRWDARFQKGWILTAWRFTQVLGSTPSSAPIEIEATGCPGNRPAGARQLHSTQFRTRVRALIEERRPARIGDNDSASHGSVGAAITKVSGRRDDSIAILQITPSRVPAIINSLTA